MPTPEFMYVTDGRRGLLTDREREILQSDGEDVTEKYYSVVVTRVRNKIQIVERDLDALEKHDTLADELRQIIDDEER